MLDITGVRTNHIHNRECSYVGYNRCENYSHIRVHSRESIGTLDSIGACETQQRVRQVSSVVRHGISVVRQVFYVIRETGNLGKRV